MGIVTDKAEVAYISPIDKKSIKTNINFKL